MALPGFHEGAALDWILWWLGLDPAELPPAEKRNRLRLPSASLVWAEERLVAVRGPRVLFVWRASTSVRSMPDAVAASFARDLLAVAPDLTLVTESALGLRHERLLDLGAEADSPERMMALVASVEGLISIDSLAPHVADAADVPCLLLLNTLPPERFPYYPRMRILVPTGMEQLPGWGATKVSDETWAEAGPLYATAWESWAGTAALKSWLLLAERMALRPPAEKRRGVATGEPYKIWGAPLPTSGARFPHDRADALGEWFDREILRFAATVLRPGATLVVASGGDPVLALGQLVAPDGAVHALEPRRLRAQALSAAAQDAGLATLHLWPAMAGASAGRSVIPDFDPSGEANLAEWGNLSATVPAMVACLDALPLSECHLIVLRPPQDPVSALAGGGGLIDACRPLIVAAPVASASLPALKDVLVGRNYSGWLSWPDRGNVDAALLIAAPREIEAQFDGFTAL